jgi:hypothetical protein
MSDGFLDKCLNEVGAMIHPIWEGHFDIVGWDEEGRMELEVSAQGAEHLGSPLGERFFSGIGLIGALTSLAPSNSRARKVSRFSTVTLGL